MNVVRTGALLLACLAAAGCNPQQPSRDDIPPPETASAPQSPEGSPPGITPAQDRRTCDGLNGQALDDCLQQASQAPPPVDPPTPAPGEPAPDPEPR